MTPSVTVIKLVQRKGIHVSPYTCKIEGGPHMKEQEELLASSDWSPLFTGQAERTAKPLCLETCSKHEKKMSWKLKGGNFSLLQERLAFQQRDPQDLL